MKGTGIPWPRNRAAASDVCHGHNDSLQAEGRATAILPWSQVCQAHHKLPEQPCRALCSSSRSPELLLEPAQLYIHSLPIQDGCLSQVVVLNSELQCEASHRPVFFLAQSLKVIILADTELSED